MTLAALHAALPAIATNKLRVALKLLRDGGLVRSASGVQAEAAWQVADATLPPRTVAARIAELAGAYRDKADHDRRMLERMVFYAQAARCRWRMLLEYFGEEVEWSACGTCDNCLHPPELAPVPGDAEGHAERARHPPAAHAWHTPFDPGALVSVPRYGEGRVEAVAGERITIVFPDGATRNFRADYVRAAVPARSDPPA